MLPKVIIVVILAVCFAVVDAMCDEVFLRWKERKERQGRTPRPHMDDGMDSTRR